MTSPTTKRYSALLPLGSRSSQSASTFNKPATAIALVTTLLVITKSVLIPLFFYAQYVAKLTSRINANEPTCFLSNGHAGVANAANTENLLPQGYLGAAIAAAPMLVIIDTVLSASAVNKKFNPKLAAITSFALYTACIGLFGFMLPFQAAEKALSSDYLIWTCDKAIKTLPLATKGGAVTASLLITAALFVSLGMLYLVKSKNASANAAAQSAPAAENDTNTGLPSAPGEPSYSH